MFWMRNKENSFPIHTLIWRSEVLRVLILALVAILFKGAEPFGQFVRRPSEEQLCAQVS